MKERKGEGKRDRRKEGREEGGKERKEKRKGRIQVSMAERHLTWEGAEQRSLSRCFPVRNCHPLTCLLVGLNA